MEPQVALDSEACLHPVNILIKDGDCVVTASFQNHDVQLPGVVLCLLFCSHIICLSGGALQCIIQLLIGNCTPHWLTVPNVAKKQTRQWAAWTRQEEESFFTALRQVGKVGFCLYDLGFGCFLGVTLSNVQCLWTEFRENHLSSSK